MRAPIHSKKHYVQISQGTTAQAAISNHLIIESLEGASSVPTQIEEGATVKAVFIEYWIGNASTSVVGSYTVIVVKNPGGNANPVTGDLAALHDYDNKKNILFTSQAIVPPTDGGQIMVLRQWIKIPKGKQRFGLKDRLQLSLRNNNLTAVDINHCGFALYKEYT